MSFKSVLAVIGKDVAKVFNWLGSAQAQKVIATGEQVVEDVYPEATGIINLANTGLVEAIKLESLAVGAGQQSGSGVQKAAALVNALTPEALAYAKQHGFPPPSSSTIQKAADGLVQFLNALAGDSAMPPATGTPAPAPTGSSASPTGNPVAVSATPGFAPAS